MEKNTTNGHGELTTAQRAVLGVALLDEERRLAVERQEAGNIRGRLMRQGLPVGPSVAGGEALEVAAARVGIGKTSLEAAEAIASRSPEMFERLRNGELNLADACRELNLGPGRFYDRTKRPARKVKKEATAADNIHAAHFYTGLASGVLPVFDQIPERQLPGLLREAEEALAWWNEIIVTLKEGIKP